MPFEIWYSNRFKRQYKKLERSGNIKTLKALKTVIILLTAGKKLPERYCEHKLTGDLDGFLECHVQPDWLLIYAIRSDILVLEIISTGSHSELFS
jgi:mRNA interferase YafQ